MKIDTKFDIGQGVFFVKRHDTQILKTCPVCKGTREIDVPKHGRIRCPNQCRDTGDVVGHIESEWSVGGSMVIRCMDIQLLVIGKGTRYHANYSGHCHNHGEHHLFASKIEAEAWCVITNKDPMGDDVFHGKDVFLPAAAL